MWNHSVILHPVIHLQGNKKHYWDNKDNRALKRKTKSALFILASKYGEECIWCLGGKGQVKELEWTKTDELKET